MTINTALPGLICFLGQPRFWRNPPSCTPFSHHRCQCCTDKTSLHQLTPRLTPYLGDDHAAHTMNNLIPTNHSALFDFLNVAHALTYAGIGWFTPKMPCNETTGDIVVLYKHYLLWPHWKQYFSMYNENLGSAGLEGHTQDKD